MAKYSIELAQKMAGLIADEFYTISEVCMATGVSRQAFYNWMDSKEEFRLEIEQAMKHRETELMGIVQASLKKKLEGYYTLVEKDVYVPDETTGEAVLKSKTITKKECPPDLRTIKMLLDRNDKKDSSQSQTGKDEKYIPGENETGRKEEELPGKQEEREEIVKAPVSEACAEKDVSRPISPVMRKNEQKKKRNMTREKIKKHVNFVKF
ncbi:hypothetical protein GGR21_000373 [Dysgonomonas hofstadii]|uniref:Homeodomain phBC6A51-type domain-containing protein n=1 Tax=Dysgonomonas hofstadii TaxID=637886 RepID=A0A840CKC9_9BACT|nr:hypothetical protein [Dysgonomonas hofstadii]MBB4034488.1 hypothetical protein [Dysgonomonas hofstadii]